MKTYQERTYRSLVNDDRLRSFRVAVKETDLLVRSKKLLEKEARDLVLKYRLPLERYIEDHPEFLHCLVPFAKDRFAPPIVRTMIEAGRKAGVGPMAAVAGAIAEYVGKDLLSLTDEVIVENGGDIFINAASPLIVAVYAGESPLSNKLGIRITCSGDPLGVCTSSGTVGHSLSFGKADAVVVISDSAALADAAATSIGNKVTGKRDVAATIDFGKEIEGVQGIVVVIDDELGVWGKMELIRLAGTG
jgi:ApbE superfamily uncharacterized protein (UPF0280 family)